MSKKEEVLMNGVRDALIRVEGALNFLRNSPTYLAYTKLQGLKDSLGDLLVNISEYNDPKVINETTEAIEDALESIQKGEDEVEV